MRENLIRYNQGVYRARFGGFGHKLTRYGPTLTVLLLDVTFARKGTAIAVADHLWADFHEGFVNESCRPGDIVEIDGHTKKYRKSFWNGIGNDSDYKLIINKVRKIISDDS